MNIKSKIKGIEFKTLIFILLFNVVIILLIFFCESILFNVFYRNYQIKKINTIVEEFRTSKEDTYILADTLSYENEVCMSVVDSNNIVFNFNTSQKGCLLNKKNAMTIEIMNNFINSNNQSTYKKIFNPITKTKGILYGFKNRRYIKF